MIGFEMMKEAKDNAERMAIFAVDIAKRLPGYEEATEAEKMAMAEMVINRFFK